MKPNYITFELNEESTSISGLIDVIGTIAENHHIRFDPISPEQIHMTVVFLGNIMKGMQKQQRALLMNVTNSLYIDPAIAFTFAGLELFGNHQNLLIAKFSTAKTNIDTIISFKKKFECFGTRPEDFFVPHITLGKISSTSSEVNNILGHLTFPTILVNKVKLV